MDEFNFEEDIDYIVIETREVLELIEENRTDLDTLGSASKQLSILGRILNLVVSIQHGRNVGEEIDIGSLQELKDVILDSNQDN